MYNKRTKIVFYELCLINFLFFLRWRRIYQILLKMQKNNMLYKIITAKGNKQDSCPQKIKR